MFAALAVLLSLVSITTHSALTSCMASVLWLMYQLADVADGAHARGSGQGSPLGGLVDHCIDVLVCTLAMLALFTVIALPCDSMSWTMIFGINASGFGFFSAAWSERILGYLDDRGAVDMNVLGMTLLALPAVLGREVFCRTVGTITLGDVVMSAITLFGLAKCVVQVIEVIRQQRGRIGVPADFLPVLLHQLAWIVIRRCRPTTDIGLPILEMLVFFSGFAVTNTKC